MINYNIEFNFKFDITDCMGCPFRQQNEDFENLPGDTHCLTYTIEIRRIVSTCGLDNSKIEHPKTFGGNDCPVEMVQSQVEGR